MMEEEKDQEYGGEGPGWRRTKRTMSKRSWNHKDEKEK